MVVPSLGLESTVRLPPIALARYFMMWIPMPPVLGLLADMPLPVSWTAVHAACDRA